MAYLLVVYLPLLFLSANGGEDAYKQIYPPVNDSLLNSPDYCDPDSNQTCPLFIAFLSSFGGIYKSNGGIPGVQIALDEINRDSSMLPGYSLHYTLKDSNVKCSRQVALSSFYTQMFQPPTKLGVIGSGCSEATEPTVETAYFFNLTQLSCFPTSLNGSKSSFHLLSSETNLAYGYFGIVKEFRWRKVAIITQNENIFTQAMDVLTELLVSNNINYTETVFLSERGVDSLQFDKSARIFLLSMCQHQAREVLCKAYQGRMYYPRYQFIMPGWYGERWWVGDNATQRNLMEKYQCSVANREQVLAYSLTVLQDEFLKNNSTVADSGKTGTRFYEEYDDLIATSDPSFNLEPTVYAQQCYDATWTYARAFNKTLTVIRENETLRNSLRQFNSGLDPGDEFDLQHFTYNNSAMLNLMIDNIANTDFLGLTGNIRFDNNRAKIVLNAIIRQYRNSSEKGDWKIIEVAEVDFSNTSDLLFSYEEGFSNGSLWPHGLIPYDGVPVVVIDTVHVGIIVAFSILVAGGIIFGIICLLFSFYYRNTKLMKLSSRNLNYLIGVGAILLYVSILFFIIPTTDGPTFVLFLNLSIWMTSVGYCLCFGTVIMKMVRIWYIFHKPLSTTSKKTIRDWMLAIGIVILISIEFIISTVYTIVYQDLFFATLIPNGPDEVIGILGIIKQHQHFLIEIEQPRTLILSVLEVFFLLVALMLAFCTSSVKVKGLDDSRYVKAAVYFTATAYIIYLVTGLTSNHLHINLNTEAALGSSLYFICVTVILLLTYVPKMVLLYKDPDCQTLFETMGPPTELNINTSEKRQNIYRGSTISSLKNGPVKNGGKVFHRRATCSVALPSKEVEKMRLKKKTSCSSVIVHSHEDCTDGAPVSTISEENLDIHVLEQDSC